jgi:hypothetical protein
MFTYRVPYTYLLLFMIGSEGMVKPTEQPVTNQAIKNPMHTIQAHPQFAANNNNNGEPPHP